MRTVIVTVETSWTGANEIIEIEVDDNASDEEIEELARDEFFELCNYGWYFAEDIHNNSS